MSGLSKAVLSGVSSWAAIAAAKAALEDDSDDSDFGGPSLQSMDVENEENDNDSVDSVARGRSDDDDSVPGASHDDSTKSDEYSQSVQETQRASSLEPDFNHAVSVSAIVTYIERHPKSKSKFRALFASKQRLALLLFSKAGGKAYSFDQPFPYDLAALMFFVSFAGPDEEMVQLARTGLQHFSVHSGAVGLLYMPTPREVQLGLQYLGIVAPKHDRDVTATQALDRDLAAAEGCGDVAGIFANEAGAAPSWHARTCSFFESLRAVYENACSSAAGVPADHNDPLKNERDISEVMTALFSCACHASLQQPVIAEKVLGCVECIHALYMLICRPSQSHHDQIMLEAVRNCSPLEISRLALRVAGATPRRRNSALLSLHRGLRTILSDSSVLSELFTDPQAGSEAAGPDPVSCGAQSPSQSQSYLFSDLQLVSKHMGYLNANLRRWTPQELAQKIRSLTIYFNTLLSTLHLEAPIQHSTEFAQFLADLGRSAGSLLHIFYDKTKRKEWPIFPGTEILLSVVDSVEHFCGVAAKSEG